MPPVLDGNILSRLAGRPGGFFGLTMRAQMRGIAIRIGEGNGSPLRDPASVSIRRSTRPPVPITARAGRVSMVTILMSLVRSPGTGPGSGAATARPVWVPRLVLALPILASTALGQKDLLGWGANIFNTSWNSAPDPGVQAGEDQTFALRADGSLEIWGSNAYGLCKAPPLDRKSV